MAGRRPTKARATMGKTTKRGIIDARMTLAPQLAPIGGSNDLGPGAVRASAGASTTEGET